MEQQMRVLVKCPTCGWRLMDKITPAKGKVKIKCPRCRKVVEVDLALRKARPQYRMNKERVSLSR